MEDERLVVETNRRSGSISTHSDDVTAQAGKTESRRSKQAEKVRRLAKKEVRWSGSFVCSYPCEKTGYFGPSGRKSALGYW